MWQFSQSSGAVLNAEGHQVGRAYAGMAPLGKNNPAMQEVHNVGPLPRGAWTIGEPITTEKHGPYVLPLTPDDDTELYGRSGFLMHGERKEGPPGFASNGCIIAARTLRELIWTSGDHRLEVTE